MEMVNNSRMCGTNKKRVSMKNFSKKEDSVERQHEDSDFLMIILENKMNLVI